MDGLNATAQQIRGGEAVMLAGRSDQPCEGDGSHRVAILRVSAELLCHALCLPKGTVIHAIRERNNLTDSGIGIELRIESPGLHPIQSGSSLPYVSASIWSKSVTAEDGARYDIPYFKEWIES